MKFLPVILKPCAGMHHYGYKINADISVHGGDFADIIICPHSGHWPVPVCLHAFPFFRALPAAGPEILHLLTICYWQFDS